jgi:tetratricopeptide (TPR) repeat protein
VGAALAALASAVAAACVTFPRAPDEGGAPWISVETPHFTLATDMEKAPAEDLARMLEDTWTAMEYALESLPGGALEDAAGSEPALVIALKNDREREAVHKRLGGIFSRQPLLPPVVSIGDISANRGVEVLQHELAHALLSKRLPRVPRWLNEGIAVYLQTAELDRDRHAVAWGIWSEHDTRMMREYVAHRASVEALFDSERWKSSSESYALEFEAGLLVHMLVNRYPGELGCYLKGLATDLDPKAAMACFPNRTRWTYEVKDYDYDAPAAGKRASFEFPDVQVSTATLGDAHVHAVLAVLDYMVVSFVEPQFQKERFERAQRHLARALEIDPAEQLATLLMLTQTDPSPARRAELAKRLVDSHPDHWATWIARAGTPGLSAEEQFAAIDRAWALAPGRAEVLGWAALRAFAESRWSEARTLAIKAWLGGIDGDDNRALVYAASVQLGACAEAESWLPPPKDRKAFLARVARMREEMNAPPGLCPVAP